MIRVKELKEEKEKVIWDKKKIIVFSIIVILLIGIGFEIKTLMLGQNYSISPKKSTSLKEQVQGVENKDLSVDIKQGIQESINNLKTEAQNIDLQEVATSSPQVQKVINDLKSLQDLPKTQIKSACEKICGSL